VFWEIISHEKQGAEGEDYGGVLPGCPRTGDAGYLERKIVSKIFP
jgi:hypothetical protein